MHSNRMHTDRGSRHLGGGGRQTPTPELDANPLPLPTRHPPSDQTLTLLTRQTPFRKEVGKENPIQEEAQEGAEEGDSPQEGAQEGDPSPIVDRMTDACENITFPNTSYAVGNYELK